MGEPDQIELSDRYAGLGAALGYYLRLGVSPPEAAEAVAANLDDEMRQEMVELGLLTLMEVAGQTNWSGS